jgi:hypothetical protein
MTTRTKEDVLSRVCAEFKDTLRRYDKEFEDRGIDANINLWLSNKWHFVEDFSKHPKWDWDALAVLMEFEESRPVSNFELHNAKEALCNVARFSRLVSTDGWLGYRAALETICDAPSKMCDRKKISRVSSATGVSVSSQTIKSSRLAQTLAVHYNIAGDSGYNEAFARFGDAINDYSVTRMAILSVHPCDYLTMSVGSSWRSCHSIVDGEWIAGTLSYMCDPVSMVLYTLKEGSGPPYHKHQKIQRTMFSYGNGRLLQGRLYPAKDEYDLGGIRPKYLELVKGVIKNGKPRAWNTLGSEATAKSGYVLVDEESRAFPDHQTASKRCTLSMMAGCASGVLEVGVPPLCILCGNQISETDTLYCGECVFNCTCGYCGNSIYHSDDVMSDEDGDHYCSNCAAFCDRCEYVYLFSEATKVCVTSNYNGHLNGRDTEYWCESCKNVHSYVCAGCSEVCSQEELPCVEVGRKRYCRECAEEYFAYCNKCCAWLEDDCVRESKDGDWVCQNCCDSLGLVECSDCLTLHKEEETRLVDDRCLCLECAGAEGAVC